MDGETLGPERQFFHRGDLCRISHNSADKMRVRGFDPQEVAEIVEANDYRIEPDLSYEGRRTLFGTLPSGRKVIVPFDRDDDEDKIELITAFGPDDPECKWFKTDRELKEQQWRRRKSGRGKR